MVGIPDPDRHLFEPTAQDWINLQLFISNEV